MKKNFISIKKKLIILCLTILIIPTIIIGISTHSIAQQQLDEAGIEHLKKSSKMVIGMIDLLDKQVQAGKLSLAEAQEMLREEILGEQSDNNKRSFNKEYTIGDTGYIWAIDREGILVMEATGNEGSNLHDTKTEDGLNLGKTLLKAAEKGEAITYQTKDPKTNKQVENLVYVEKDPNWGWVIGSNAFVSEFDNGANKVTTVIVAISVIAVTLGAIAAYYASTRITKPLAQIRKELAQIASGDFSGEKFEIENKDELGQLASDLNNMRNQMRELISQVTGSTEQVAASSEELTASAVETSNVTNEIAQSIQLVASGSENSNQDLHESAKSLEEVTIAIQKMAENAVILSKAVGQIGEQALQGSTYVNKTVQQINSISHKVNESGQVLELLDRNSKEIGEITKVINEIADQTNLLALNAAIEAARAGEHGKGFAVVADEVRKLAEQSQSSSQQISDLITDIQLNMSRSTNSMEQVKMEVQEGLEIVGQTEENFKGIVVAMKNMDDKITDMTTTVEQMSFGAQEVSTTVTTITHVTKETSIHMQNVAASTEEQLACMEEISLSSSSLSKLAMELQEQVNKFKI